MDKNFENAAKGWINQYSADVKSKVQNLLKENDSCAEELAEVINVPVEEIYGILEGSAEYISVNTLVRIFMVLGLAVEIKPIEQTPLCGYNNVNPHIERDVMAEVEETYERRREPRPNPFMRPRMGMPHDLDFDDVPPHIREQVAREFERRHPIPPIANRACERAKSPFEDKSREELANIIRKHLWDTEIDTNAATKEMLVDFLNEKDKRTRELKREETLERDPKVADFVRNMKKTIKDNPQFRSYMKNFLSELDD